MGTIGAWFAAQWLKLLLGLTVVALCFGAGVTVRGHYADKAMAEHVAQDVKDEQRRRDAVAKKDADTAAREAKAKDENSTLRAAYVTEKGAHDADNHARDADLRAARIAVRVPIVAGSCHGAASGVSPGLSTAGADDATSAQLAPEAAAGLERIADTGNDAIRQLAALQEWVDRNVRNVNAGGVPSGQQPAGVTTL